MKNRSLEAFKRDMAKYNIEPREVAPRFPYDYSDDFKAFEADNNGHTFYFVFGSDNQLIQSQVLTKWDK